MKTKSFQHEVLGIAVGLLYICQVFVIALQACGLTSYRTLFKIDFIARKASIAY
jgi:hypothetical protein